MAQRLLLYLYSLQFTSTYVLHALVRLRKGLPLGATAQRRASAAAVSGSEARADAGSRQLQALVLGEYVGDGCQHTAWQPPSSLLRRQQREAFTHQRAVDRAGESRCPQQLLLLCFGGDDIAPQQLFKPGLHRKQKLGIPRLAKRCGIRFIDDDQPSPCAEGARTALDHARRQRRGDFMEDLDHDHNVVGLWQDGMTDRTLQKLDALSEPRLVHRPAGCSQPCGV